jgi:hypothetical protein
VRQRRASLSLLWRQRPRSLADRPSPRLMAWAGLHDGRTATAASSHPQVIDPAPALFTAFAICGLLGCISLFVPPYINWDSGWGFVAWRGTLLGAANSIISPDPANIVYDTAAFLTEWSPGQYLIPGAISLIGIPIGIAMTLTAVLSLLASLIGWIMVLEGLALQTRLAVLVIVSIGLFRYSTMSFGVYWGGEVLMQAATPWLILTARRVPEMNIVPATLFTAAAVFVAFLAKLSGLIIAAAALAAGSIVALTFGRRITRGMIGGALGALAVIAVVYLGFLSRGPTAASVSNWSLPLRSVAFASLVPWVAGMSWTDLLTTIFLPGRSLWYVSITVVGLVIPPALLLAGLVVFWRPQTLNEEKLKIFSLWFYGVVAAVFAMLYIHGSTIGLEERYFRPVGILLFVCAAASAFQAGTPKWVRGLFLALCALMVLYGLASFSSRAFAAASGRSLDRRSWTNQQIYDAAAINFAREAYAREGRNALFVLPTPQIPVTLPTEARILTRDIEWGGPAASLPGSRYAGRVPGHVYVLIPNNLVDTTNARELLSAFTDYAPNAWERKTFANMSVFFQ